MEKICTRCPERGPQPLENFSKRKRSRDGHGPWCKLCVSVYHKRWYTDNKLTKDGRNRSYYEANKDQFRSYALQAKYGISVAEYGELLAAQGGVCALCGNPETAKDGRSGVVRNLAVDHCHASNRVRGLLCYRCNHIVGCLGDNVESAVRLLAYMQRGE